MGSVQAKPPQRGAEKMRLENGYARAARRSTGQRYVTEEPGRPSRPEPRIGNDAYVGNGGRETAVDRKVIARKGEKPRSSGGKAPAEIDSKKTNSGEEEMVDGWPKWLVDNIPGQVLAGLVPKSADSYEKIDKVGSGTYSNVYKARDKETGKIVAMKKVRFDTSEPQSVKFMAREIMILQKLDHPNIIKLEGLATSRMQYSIYLVFDYMQSDLASIISRPGGRLNESQVKCYMQHLLSGLQHCHERGILHRDIKGSNLLIDKSGMLKIADFGLANFFNTGTRRPLTTRVVTLWYRAPELLLGATEYGAGIDLWSAGCLMAEMFVGRPILPGRTEVEQLNKIFKLCGTPSEEYWKKTRLPTTFRPPYAYKPCIREAFRHFPSSSSGLLHTLLALDPSHRGSAASALQNEYFYTSPLACHISELPVVHKEDPEPAIIDGRRHRASRHRSQSIKERRRKDTEADEEPKGDSGDSNEVEQLNLYYSGAGKYTDKTVMNSQESGSSSSTTTRRRSKSVKEDNIPTYTSSPVAENPEKSSRSEEADDNPNNAAMNIRDRPPRATTAKNHNVVNYKDNMHRLNHVQRSASARAHKYGSSQAS
ncbi:probable serine/threonine-protein kinase At1g54610 [Ipomoea triloba]|uniref:probable serine/threonine-protein kinase At1g54610 n=1 Tax=Ipomoea triloba TaxID=35885 RepID=UPI00125DE7CD|nr:probable serine/threonine-protein kinase At1g54610 [Ipomoea triloba]